MEYTRTYGYMTHIRAHDTHRHALIALLGFQGKVRRRHQKSPSEYQFSTTCLIILMFVKDV